MSHKLYVLIFVFVVSLSLIGAVLLSDQGTNVKSISTGNLLDSGNLTILIYDDSTGGNLIFNSTTQNAIANGSWNLVINPDLEFGKYYWKDYQINGEDLDFDGDERLQFQSSLGMVNNVSFINFSLISNCSAGSSIRLIYANGSVVCETDDSSGSSSNIFNQDLNTTNNVQFLNVTSSDSGLFSFLGSLASRISKLWVNEINATGNIQTSQNVTASYFKGDGSLLTGISSGNSYNSSYALYSYNQTVPANTYTDSRSFITSLIANNTYALIGTGGNSSWNQSYANSLYQPINIAYNLSYESTFNSSYALYAYNQTGLINVNSTTLSINNITGFLYNYNQSDGAGGNFSWNETYARTIFQLNGISYNLSYESTFNSSYALYAYNQTGLINVNSTTLSINNITGFLYNYNQSDGAGGNFSWNETYARTIFQLNGISYNLSYESTFNSSYALYAYNQTGLINVNSTTLSINNITGFLYNYNQSDGAGGNFSWNETYARTIFQLNGIAYNLSYESTFNSSYALYAYNQTGLINVNSTTLSINNITGFLYNYNQSDGAGGNFSWNETYARTIFQLNGISYNLSYESTFNSSYALYAYNQTIVVNPFNQVLNRSSNVTFANVNATYGNFTIGLFVNMKDVETWLYNQTIPALIISNASINSLTNSINSTINIQNLLNSTGIYSTYNVSYVTQSTNVAFPNITSTGNLTTSGVIYAQGGINVTSKNITQTDCIIFRSGGKICSA